MNKPTSVKPGQVWLDKDIRAKCDEFTVLGVVEGDLVKAPYAICQRGKRKVKIRISRLLAPETPTRGYEYIGMQR